MWFGVLGLSLRRHASWYAGLVLLLLAVGWTASEQPPAPSLVDVELAQEAIRRLVGDPDYPVTYVSLQKPYGARSWDGQKILWGKWIYEFAGLKVGNAEDRFRVHAETGEVLSAWLHTQEDVRVQDPTLAISKRFWLPRDYGRRKALRIARTNCPGFDELHMTLMPQEFPESFHWQGIDPQTGAILPSEVDVHLDPINGQLVGWEMTRRPVQLPIHPRLTETQVRDLIRQGCAWAREPITVVLRVISLEPRSQEIVWDVTVHWGEGTDGPTSLVGLDDASGKVRYVFDGPDSLLSKPDGSGG